MKRTRLEAAEEAALQRGWRIVDLEHGFRKMLPATHLALLGALDRGLIAWQTEQGIDAEHASLIAGELTRFLGRLPTMIPTSDHAASAVEGKLLTRVRALLAKAESTDYEPEAEALWTKAHELMTRHALDHADVASSGHATSVVRRRVIVDDPYVYQHMVLLDEVARACGCRAVLNVKLGLATVFGDGKDVDTTEVLYTSLLVQASLAMKSATTTPAGAPATVAAFRRSFLTGFAQRVGFRLYELRQAVVDEVAEARHDLLPVLAERESAVDAEVERYTVSTIRRRRSSDIEGHLAGDRAGMTASLGTSNLQNSANVAIGDI